MDANKLWWTPFHSTYKQLQGLSDASREAVGKLLASQQDWLLANVAGFQRPSADARKQVAEQASITIQGKKLNVDPKLRDAAFQVSKLLDLNEIQAYILLKRWLDASGGVDLSASSKLVLSLDDLPQVLDFYCNERLSLLKCVLFVVLSGLAVGREDEVLSGCRAKLLDAGLEGRLVEALAAALAGRWQQAAAAAGTGSATAAAGFGAAATTSPSAPPPPSGDAITAHVIGLMKDFAPLASAASAASGDFTAWLAGLQHAMREQLAKEACDLMAGLTALYGALGVGCDASHLVQLTRLCGTHFFRPAPERRQQPQLGGGHTAHGLLVQHLAAPLLLAALDLPGCLDLAALPPDAVAAAGDDGEATASAAAAAAAAVLPFAASTCRELSEELASWEAAPPAAAALLTFAAVLKVIDLHGGAAGLGEPGAADEVVKRLSDRAFAAGGFAAMAGVLDAGVLPAGSSHGQLVRRLMAEALSLVTAAFDVSQARVDPGSMAQFLSLLAAVLCGQPSLCEAVWDPQEARFAPLVAVLHDAFGAFPALPLGDPLGLLAAFSQGPAAAARAYAFLEAEPFLVIAHDGGDPALLPSGGGGGGGGGGVVLTRDTPWNRAPDVASTVLPAGLEGEVLAAPPQLAAAAAAATAAGGAAAGKVLVRWHTSPQGGVASFGQLLLLARGVQCLLDLERSAAGDAAAQQRRAEARHDLAAILQLMSQLLGQNPALAPRLFDESFHVVVSGGGGGGGGVARNWGDVACGAAALLSSQQAFASPSDADALAAALSMLSALALHMPRRTIAMLSAMPLFETPHAVSLGGGAAASVSTSAGGGGGGSADYCYYALSQLPAADVPGVPTSQCAGFLPRLRQLQQGVEALSGRYPVSRAHLALLSCLLRQGWWSGPAVATHVLYVVHELLPGLQHWAYQPGAAGAEERWALTQQALALVRLAVTAGAHALEPKPSTSAAELDDASSAALPSGELPQADGRVMLSGLSAHVLRQLCFHGAALLSGVLPPPADFVLHVRSAHEEAPQVAAMWAAAGEFFALLPLALRAARTFSQVTPLEAYLTRAVSSVTGTPTALVASYVSHSAVLLPMAPLQPASLPLSALRALHALSLTLARHLPGGGGGGGGTSAASNAASGLAAPSLASLLPEDGAERSAGLAAADGSGSSSSRCAAAVCAFTDPSSAERRPELLAAAIDLLVHAADSASDLLDVLLFPSGLESDAAGGSGGGPGTGGGGAALATTPGGGDQAAAGAAGAPSSALAPAGGRKPAASKRPRAFSMLDGLWGLVQALQALVKEAPHVAAHVMRGLGALWRNQVVTHRAVELLRSQPGFWKFLEAALPTAAAAAAAAPPPSPAAASPAAGHLSPGGAGPAEEEETIGSEADAWRGLAQALAWQLLTDELMTRPRDSADSAAAGADGAAAVTAAGGLSSLAGATAAAASGSFVWELLASWSEGGRLAAVAGRAARRLATLLQGRTPLRRLHHALQAACLELGCASRVLQPASPSGQGAPGAAAAAAATGRLELTAISAALREELSGLAALCAGGAVTERDLLDADSFLLEHVADAPDGHPVLAQLATAPCGAALLSRCKPLGFGGAAEGGCPAYGPAFAVDRLRLVGALGCAAVEMLRAADPLAIAMDRVSLVMSEAHAQLAVLQASATLLAAMRLDAQLCAGLVQAAPDAAMQAADVTTLCSGLLTAGGADPVRHVVRAPHGLAAAGSYGRAAAAAASKLLLRSMALVKAAVAASAAPNGAAPAAASAASDRLLLFRLPAAVAASPPPLTPLTGDRHRAAAAALPKLASKALLLLAAWLRVVQSGAARAAPATLRCVTADVTRAALLAVQCIPPPASPATSSSSSAASAAAAAAADYQVMQAAAVSMLPQLCACGRGGQLPLSAGVGLICVVVRHHLAPREWLPVVRQHLDVPALLAQAAANMRQAALSGGGVAGKKPAAAGEDDDDASADLGMLQLAVVVAQTPEGAALLADQGVLEQLAVMARALLAADGGALHAPIERAAARGGGGGGSWEEVTTTTTTFMPSGGGASYVSATTSTTTASGFGGLASGCAAAAAAPESSVELGGAYGADGCWSPVHQQWCVLLTFAGCLLRTLGQSVNVEGPAVDLLLTLEQRLLWVTGVQLGGSPAAPLTLALLTEQQRALFLLSQLARYVGAWHLSLPMSLPSFRARAAQLVHRVARPSLRRPGGTQPEFSASCGPRSPAERQMAAAPCCLPRTEGWFRVAARGSGELDPSQQAAAAGTMSTPAASGGAGRVPIVETPGSPMTPLHPGARQQGGVGGWAAAAAGGSASAGGGGSSFFFCSEYSGRLGEAQYAVAHHALLFLLATAPDEVSEGEAGSLGPMWPSMQALLALRDQAAAVGESLLTAPPAEAGRGGGGGGGTAMPPRRVKLAGELLRIVQAATHFIAVLTAASDRPQQQQQQAAAAAAAAAALMPGSSSSSGATGGLERAVAKEALSSSPVMMMASPASGGGAGPAIGPLTFGSPLSQPPGTRPVRFF